MQFLNRVVALAAGAALIFAAPASAVSQEQWWLADYGFTAAWEQTRGAGVTVAVIDTGIDGTHPDLIGVVADGADFSGLGTPDGLTPVGPSSFHGTMVASLLAGQGEKTQGVSGVAPDVKLLSASIGLGIAGADTDAQIAAAIIWAVDAGASVINLSLTRNSASWPRSWDEAFLYAFDKDVVVVAASGNSTSGVTRLSAPASIPGVVAIAGVDRNRGSAIQASVEGISVAVAAPAEELLGSYPGGEVRAWSGSSAATPIVSGLVALMRAAHPEANAETIIQRLLDSADDAGDPGFDVTYGWGIINPIAALALETPSQSANPLGSLASWVELYREASGASPAAPQQPVDLVLPAQPGQVVDLDSDANQQAPLQAESQSNRLTYWVLVALAVLLLIIPSGWIIIRATSRKPRG